MSNVSILVGDKWGQSTNLEFEAVRRMIVLGKPVVPVRHGKGICDGFLYEGVQVTSFGSDDCSVRLLIGNDTYCPKLSSREQRELKELYGDRSNECSVGFDEQKVPVEFQQIMDNMLIQRIK